MLERIPTKVIKDVSISVAEYFLGKSGDNFFDTFSARHKIKKILIEDKTYIKKQFKKFNIISPDIIETFLFEDIFQDSIFLYPVSSIPEDRAKLLWERFCIYIRENCDSDISSSLEDYRIALEECLNNHNKLIDKHLLSESDRIILKTIHRNQSDLFGYIGKTLDANSELQLESSILDYTHKQIEGILHALRMDMRHYKILLVLYSIGILVIEFVSIIILPKVIYALGSSIADYTAIVLASIIMMIIVFMFLLLLGLFLSTIRNIKICENRISAWMSDLWELHFTCYKSQFAVYYNQLPQSYNI